MENNATKDLTTLQCWVLAIRPKTLPAAIAPVVLGSGIAADTGVFAIGPALAAMLCALMIQIATNLVNDVVDFSKGADTEERTGPTRVTQTGLLTSRQVWLGVWVTIGVAILAGSYLAWQSGWVVVWIGLASILAGIAYTAGPFPLAYYGYGDLFVMIFFGFAAVCGTVFVTSGQLPPAAWLGGAAAGALTVNILVVNNIRDIASDRQAGRTNLAIRFGRKAAAWEYGLMLALAYAVPPVLVIKGWASAWALIAWVSLPTALRLLDIVRGELSGQALNPILGRTAQLLLAFCVLLAAGLLLGRIG